MLPDTQNKADNRNIVIDKVGIKDIKHPISYIDRDNSIQNTIGTWQMTVELSADVKGTHMSRFIEVLNNDTISFSVYSFEEIIKKVIDKLKTQNAEVKVEFPMFINKTAPASKVKSLLDYQATIISTAKDGKIITTIKVIVAVTSLCPCSKSISKYGAHNQRSNITIEAVIDSSKVSFEDLILIAEKNASSELYAILKREDEKIVTERAYDNPVFVEDLVRDIAIDLNNNNGIISWSLESENFESIHNHSAYALIKS